MNTTPPLTAADPTTGTPRLTAEVLATPDDVGRHVAARIATALATAARRHEPFVLGCPSGRSPEPVLTHLARAVSTRDLDLRGLRVVMMDEYLRPLGDDRYAAVDADEPHSCRGFALRRIVAPLNQAAGAGRGIRPDHVHLADPADPAAFEDTLTTLGGIDLFLLATGASDGHVAFNPPGSARDSLTRIVELAATTRHDNLATFPTFGSLANVPTHGITVGIHTILAHSRSAVMIAHGPAKSLSVHRILRSPGYDPDWPATVLVECQDRSMVVDRAAAAGLPPALTTHLESRKGE